MKTKTGTYPLTMARDYPGAFSLLGALNAVEQPPPYRTMSSADPRLERAQLPYDSSQEGWSRGQPLPSFWLLAFTVLTVEQSSGLPTGYGYKKEATWANTSI